MIKKKLTSISYWDNFYKNHTSKNYSLPDLSKNNQHINNQIFKKIKFFYKEGETLEIGAGSSDWLLLLASAFKQNNFSGLDYSKIGCDLIKKKSKEIDVDINIYCEDLFKPPSHLLNKFTFVTSFGVVEHFEDLSGVLRSCSELCSAEGVHFAVIPNMKGISGLLTKLLDKETYNIHNALNLKEFVLGHKEANLEIIHAEYLCSLNIGVISSSIRKYRGSFLIPTLYKLALAFNMIISIFEKYIFELPSTSFLSPYILVVSKRK